MNAISKQFGHDFLYYFHIFLFPVLDLDHRLILCMAVVSFAASIRFLFGFGSTAFLDSDQGKIKESGATVEQKKMLAAKKVLQK
jgi:hypothetical protein